MRGKPGSVTVLTPEQAEAEERRFVARVFAWMFVGLLVSAGVATALAAQPKLVAGIASARYAIPALLGADFLLALAAANFASRLSLFATAVVFLLFSALNGFAFGELFLAFGVRSITTTFQVTAGMFGAMALYGALAGRDPSSSGHLFVMSVLGIAAALVVGLSTGTAKIQWVLPIAGVLTFTGLLAANVSLIKQLNLLGNEGTDDDRREAWSGALLVYVDLLYLLFRLGAGIDRQLRRPGGMGTWGHR